MNKTIKQINPQPARGTFKPEMWDDTKYIAEKKLNGVRELAHFEADRVYYTSRRISKKTGQFAEKGLNFPHINKAITELVGTVLDGEMVLMQGGAEKVYDVMKITGALPEQALATQQEVGYVTYSIFDILFYKGEDVRSKTFMERRKILETVFNKFLKKNKGFEIAKIVRDDKKGYFEKLVKDGFEGIILKDVGHIYGNHRGWIKVKREETYDVVVIGYLDANQFSTKVDGTVSETHFWKNGWIGAIKMGQLKDGKMIDVGSCSGMTDADRKEISENKEKYLNTAIEIKCQERTPAGFFQNPVFVRFRNDKDAKACTMRSAGN